MDHCHGLQPILLQEEEEVFNNFSGGYYAILGVEGGDFKSIRFISDAVDRIWIGVDFQYRNHHRDDEYGIRNHCDASSEGRSQSLISIVSTVVVLICCFNNLWENLRSIVYMIWVSVQYLYWGIED